MNSYQRRVWVATVTLAVLAARPAGAVDIQGVQNGALDAPQVVALVQRPGDPGPIEVDGNVAAIPGYLDTGTSGMIILPSFADSLGLNTVAGVTFSDVGLGGPTNYDVSEEITVKVAPNPFVAPTQVSSYNHDVGPLRAQVGPRGGIPGLGDNNIFGMPTMLGKVTVIDPKPLNQLLINPLEGGGLNTYLYDPGTPYHPATADMDPGIPNTNYHVQLSYGDFSRFTQTTPSVTPPVELAHNPFIGPDPTLQLEQNPPVDNTPPVNIGFNGLTTSGSFLLDTGAQASFISSELAAQLHVREVPATIGTSNPQLETFDPDNPDLPGTLIDNQFDLSVIGTGGQTTAPGFFLDSLALSTLEGSTAADDPNNLRFLGAPVVVSDVGVEDPTTGDFLILDGIFGMNFLVASQFVDGTSFGNAALGAFDWVTFDEPNGILGLDLMNVPEPGSFVMAGIAAVLLAGFAWRRRRHRR